jgi:hypothetical protein
MLLMILAKCVGSDVGDGFNFGAEWGSGTSLSVGALILVGITVSGHVPHRHKTPVDSSFSLTNSLFSLGANRSSSISMLSTSFSLPSLECRVRIRSFFSLIERISIHVGGKTCREGLRKVSN